ncbi:unnamed protein product [Tetraodon nigroviridis]|uniref:(spotted green pufferfish) hypothetical protein n=1 Tax=Tetraodon nigroviridis TaxID=99883 RepID=Q4S0Q8_TETNG|nr:unnamed protein product [Tetraodon nigroviridis]
MEKATNQTVTQRGNLPQLRHAVSVQCSRPSSSQPPAPALNKPQVNVYRKVNLEPELLMVESKVQTAGYCFISCVLTLSCISACTDEIHAGREAVRDKKGREKRRP